MQDRQRGRLGLCPRWRVPHGNEHGQVLGAAVQAVVLLVGRVDNLWDQSFGFVKANT